MRLFGVRPAVPQQQNFTYNDTNGLGRTGSWLAFTAAGIAACVLIFSAGAQNVAHGWALGAATSEFRALVLAAVSAGASALGPCAWLAVYRGRGFGLRATALVLAVGCLFYAGICSLGFIHSSRDKAAADIAVTADAYGDRRAVAAAARAELATLATVKTPSRAVIERRRELAKLLAPTAPIETRTAAPRQADPQAAAVAFYLRAAGWQATDDAVGVWLSLGMVAFLELAAALSLTVAAALRPVSRKSRMGSSPAAENVPATRVPAMPETAASDAPVQPALDLRNVALPAAASAVPAVPKKPVPAPTKDDDDAPPPPKPRGRGRPATVLAPQAVERLRKAGGSANGSIRTIGKLLGAKSKTAAHRLIHQLSAAGHVRLATGPGGISVALA
jgi:hypothetical protein